MDSKKERTVAVPVSTLEWWRQLSHDNPQDLLPRIDGYLKQAEIDRRAEFAVAALTATGEIKPDAADFSDALVWLKEGKRVQRAGWNGAGQWVRIRFGCGAFGWDDSNKAYMLSDTLMLKNAQGLLVAWIPSMGDLMATDWEVVTD